MILSENRKTTFRDHAVCWGSRPPPVPSLGAGTDRFCRRILAPAQTAGAKHRAGR